MLGLSVSSRRRLPDLQRRLGNSHRGHSRQNWCRQSAGGQSEFDLGAVTGPVGDLFTGYRVVVCYFLQGEPVDE